MATAHSTPPKLEYVNVPQHTYEEMRRKELAYDELVKALAGEHKAADWLLARLIELDPNFMPSKSPVWDQLMAGRDALIQAGVA